MVSRLDNLAAGGDGLFGESSPVSAPQPPAWRSAKQEAVWAPGQTQQQPVSQETPEALQEPEGQRVYEWLEGDPQAHAEDIRGNFLHNGYEIVRQY